MLRRSLSLIALLALPAATLAREGGEPLPPRVEVADEVLTLNGSGSHRMLMANLYSLGLYLEQPTQDAREAVRSDQTKRLHLRALRDLPRSQVARALEQGFARGAGPEEVASYRPQLDRLLARLRDVRRGDDLLLTYVPGEGTVLEATGAKELVIPGKDFAEALFSIWLGPQAEVTTLKRALLGLAMR